MHGGVFLLKNPRHFFKSIGFYPVQPLENIRFGICCLLFPSLVIIITSLRLLNKSNDMRLFQNSTGIVNGNNPGALRL
jgi:hypothetical protein